MLAETNRISRDEYRRHEMLASIQLWVILVVFIGGAAATLLGLGAWWLELFLAR